jgi:hypothetical protein
MAVNFKELLNKTVTEEAKRPPVLPAGTFHGNVQKWEPGESDAKKTPYVRFLVALTGPGDDIPSDEMTGIDLAKRQMRRDFYLTEDALYRLHEFLSSCGIDFVGRPLSQSLDETIGKDVLLTVTSKPNKNNPEAGNFNDISDMKGKQDD